MPGLVVRIANCHAEVACSIPNTIFVEKLFIFFNYYSFPKQCIKLHKYAPKRTQYNFGTINIGF